MGMDTPTSEVGAAAVVLDQASGVREEVEDGAGKRARLLAGKKRRRARQRQLPCGTGPRKAGLAGRVGPAARLRKEGEERKSLFIFPIQIFQLHFQMIFYSF